MFLKLSGMIEGQLRDAYAKKYEAGALNQSSLAEKLGINRSAVHHRLAGRTNMTIETIADMVWGLDHDIELKIFDPAESVTNNTTRSSASDERSVRPPEETALMKIASAPPTSNTIGPQLLGGGSSPTRIRSTLNYTAQLAGTK